MQSNSRHTLLIVFFIVDDYNDFFTLKHILKIKLKKKMKNT